MTAADSPTPQDRLVLTGTLFRRRSSRVLLTEQPPPAKPEPVRRPAKVARMLALAHHLWGAIDRGLVADRAASARKLGLTRAPVTQFLDLLLLAPDLHSQVLELDPVDGAEPTAERTSPPALSWQNSCRIMARPHASARTRHAREHPHDPRDGGAATPPC